jgi:hypothetical protein
VITLDKVAEVLHSEEEPFFFYDDHEGETSKDGTRRFEAKVCCLTVTLDETILTSQVARYYEEGPYGYNESGGAEFFQRINLIAEPKLSITQLEHAQSHGFEPIGLLGLQALSEAFTCQYYGACGNECSVVSDPVVWTAPLITLWEKLAKESCECGQHAQREIKKLRELAQVQGRVD